MSEKPLAERLQLKGSRRLAIAGASPEQERKIAAGAARAEVGEADVVLLFARNRSGLETDLPGLLAQARPGAILWVAYPKLSSSLAADLSRDLIRELAPAHGLDTVSHIAIDGDWSGLRLKRVD